MRELIIISLFVTKLLRKKSKEHWIRWRTYERNRKVIESFAEIILRYVGRHSKLYGTIYYIYILVNYYHKRFAPPTGLVHDTYYLYDTTVVYSCVYHNTNNIMCISSTLKCVGSQIIKSWTWVLLLTSYIRIGEIQIQIILSKVRSNNLCKYSTTLVIQFYIMVFICYNFWQLIRPLKSSARCLFIIFFSYSIIDVCIIRVIVVVMSWTLDITTFTVSLYDYVFLLWIV